MSNFKTKVFLILGALTLVMVGSSIFDFSARVAQATSHNEPITIPGQSSENQFTALICNDTDRLVTCLPKVINFLYIILGIVALALVVWYGYSYMSAGGNGAQSTAAKEHMSNLAMGVLLLLIAYVVLQFLNPSFTTLKETPLDTRLINPNDPRYAADTVLPVINIASPANNATISGNVLIRANASDNVGVKSVTFYRDPNPTIHTDDVVLFDDTTGPEWQYNLPTESLANGNHRIMAVVRDYKDNKASFSIVVTVSN